MPGTPGRFRESLTTEEVFPRSLPAQTQDLQLCQFPEGLLRRKMRSRGKLVYMHLGTIVQQSEQTLARFVGFHPRPLGLWPGLPGGYLKVPLHLDAEIRRIGHLPREAVPEQHLWTCRERIARRPAHREHRAFLVDRIARGDERS